MPKLTVLMGAPGAGKSTYASKFANVVTNDGRRGTPGETLHSSYKQINVESAVGGLRSEGFGNVRVATRNRRQPWQKAQTAARQRRAT